MNKCELTRCNHRKVPLFRAHADTDGDPTRCACRPLASLACCCKRLVDARYHAVVASTELTEARRTRATELTELITTALAFCERLQTVVEGDRRAEVTR